MATNKKIFDRVSGLLHTALIDYLIMVSDGEILEKFLKLSYIKKNDNNHYKKIEEKAFYTTHLVEKNGLIRCSLQVCLLSILAVISCGKFFLAGINYYGFSIVAKFNPLIKIITFDDGMANFYKKSEYFKHEKLDDNLSVLRSFLNFLFPNGSPSFLRKKTILHYTIFKNFENPVSFF